MHQRESESETLMTPQKPARHKPFVPPNVQMREFTLRAVLLGLVMCVILGRRMLIWACGRGRLSRPPIRPR